MDVKIVKLNDDFIVKFWGGQTYLIYCSDCYYNHDREGYISLLYNNCGNCFINCPIELHDKAKFIAGIS